MLSIFPIIAFLVPIIASSSSEASFSNSGSDSSAEQTSKQGKKRHRRMSKERRKQLFSLGPFSEIKDEETFRHFLEQNPNVYNSEILFMLERKKEGGSFYEYDEVHHIIPRSAGGPDDFWNLIPVTFEEHKKLHSLRFEAYGEQADLIAAKSRDGNFDFTKEEKTAAAKRGHATMQKLGIGFYDRSLQSELGQRSALAGKTKARKKGYVSQANKKGSVYLQLFQFPLLFTFSEGSYQRTVKTEPFYFSRSGEIKDFLLQHTPETSKAFRQIQNDKYCSTNFNKVLQNLLPELGIEAKGSRPHYKGWSVSLCIEKSGAELL